jgi:hypothetical protein
MLKHKLTIFMHDLRTLAVPLIDNEEYRLRCWAAHLHCEPSINSPDKWVWLSGGFGDTFRDPETDRTDIWIYHDQVRQHYEEIGNPYGMVLAFVTIHELAHAALASPKGHNDHEDKEWAALCRAMGIDEMVYSMKSTRPASHKLFSFLDRPIAQEIRELTSYPGDVA